MKRRTWTRLVGCADTKPSFDTLQKQCVRNILITHFIALQYAKCNQKSPQCKALEKKPYADLFRDL